MNEKDLHLIELAKKLHYTEWDEVIKLLDLAESEECKLKLKDILSGLYHTEEYNSGLA
jgi:hypothetical protein